MEMPAEAGNPLRRWYLSSLGLSLRQASLNSGVKRLSDREKVVWRSPAKSHCSAVGHRKLWRKSTGNGIRTKKQGLQVPKGVRMSFKVECNQLSIRKSHHFLSSLSSTENREEDMVKIQGTDPFLPNGLHKIRVFSISFNSICSYQWYWVHLHCCINITIPLSRMSPKQKLLTKP